MKFAIAPCCWGVYWPKGNALTWETYLSKIHEAGYRQTELGPFGFGPTKASDLKLSVEAMDIEIVAAAHVHTLADIATLEKLRQQTAIICELISACGASQFILMDESEFYPKDAMGVVTAEQWKNVVTQVNEAAQIARDHQLEFSFHPHVGTCIETEQQIEKLLNETDPDLVKLCLDTGHHAYWNADPVAFFNKHRSRISAIHLKNVDPDVLARVHAENIHCDTAFEIGVMTDLDKGSVNIGAFVDVLKQTDFQGPVVVEQDLSDENPRSPEEIARSNLAFLTTPQSAEAKL